MFYDLDDNPIASFSGSITEGDVQIYEMKIDCSANRYLASDPVTDAVVEARAYGDVSWVDLETTRIGLSPYAGTRKRFQFRITAGGVSAVQRLNIQFRIEP